MASEVGVAYVRLLPSMRGFAPAAQAGMTQAMVPAASKVGKKSGARAGSMFGSAVASGAMTRRQVVAGAGKKLTKGLTLPLAVVGGLAVKSFGSFDEAMNQSIAIMGKVSGPQRRKMEDAARAIGRTTRISADQAAESYFFLASAGLDAEQSVAALPQVAAFAQAGMFDMATATDLATDAQSALGLAAKSPEKNLKNLTRVTDVFVKGNTLANASVEQFSEAMTNKAGAALRVTNKDIEEGTAVLAAFADRGVKGAEAGEGLSIMLRDVTRAAEKNSDEWADLGIEVFDSEGNLKNMADVIDELDGALGGMSDAQMAATLDSLGLTRSVGDQVKLLSGAGPEIREYEKQLRNAGGTTQMVADKQMKSFNAKMQLAFAQIKDVAIRIGGALAPALIALTDAAIPLIGKIESMAHWFSELPMGVQQAALGFGAFLAVLGPILSIASKLATVLMPLAKGVLLLGKAMLFLSKMVLKAVLAFAKLAIALLTNPIFLLVAAIVAAGVAIYIFRDEIMAGLKKAWEVVRRVGGDILNWFKELPGKVVGFFSDLRTKVWNFLMDNHPAALLEKAIDNGLPALGRLIQSIAPKVARWLLGFKKTMVQFFIKWNPISVLIREGPKRTLQLAKLIKDIGPKVIRWLANFQVKVLKFIIKWHPISILIRYGPRLIRKLAGIIKRIAPGVLRWLAGLAKNVAKFIGKWHPVAVMVRIGINMLKRVARPLRNLPGNIIGWLRGLGGKVANFILRWHPMAVLFRYAKNNIGDVLRWFKNLPGKIKRALGSLKDLLVNAGKQLLRGLKRGAELAWSAVTGWLGERKKRIQRNFTRAKDWLVSAGKSIIRGLRNGLIDFFVNVVDYLKGMPDRFLRWFSDAATWLYDIGKEIINGLWEGMKDIWESTSGWLGGLGSEIIKKKGPPAKDARLLIPIGKSIINGLRSGMNAAWVMVVARLVQFTVGITRVFSNAGRSLYSAGRALINGLVQGLRANSGYLISTLRWLGTFPAYYIQPRSLFNVGWMIIDGLVRGIHANIGYLISTLAWVTSMIPNWKGPMSKDRKLLAPTGAAIIQGLGQGVEDGVPVLRRQLGDITDEIERALSPAGMGGLPDIAGRSTITTVDRTQIDLNVEGGVDKLVELVAGWVRKKGNGDVRVLAGGGRG